MLAAQGLIGAEWPTVTFITRPYQSNRKKRMDRFQSESLDRFITGSYGEDQFRDTCECEAVFSDECICDEE